MTAAKTPAANPVLTRIWRGDRIESRHRGSWVLVDAAGSALDGAGQWEEPVCARSSVKSIQALPLVESGAAERFGLSDPELALALASHNGEPCHTEGVSALLERMQLTVGHLRCGPHRPFDPETDARLHRRGEEPTALHNNCSGKHAGFLALALHLGADPRRYLDPESEGQELVRRALIEMTDAQEERLPGSTDGCSAPTFHLPLDRLATGIARVANPEGLPAERRAACERMARAVAERPELIGGTRGRLCTDLARATGGRVFPKIGGEAVYLLGVRGMDRGLAIKIDDGNPRGFNALILELLRRFELITATEAEALEEWRGSPLRNWAGLPVGHTEVVA